MQISPHIAGSGFPSSASGNVEVTAGGSPCIVQEATSFRLSCLTSYANPTEPPFPGSQGVQRLLWKTDVQTRDSDSRLARPAGEPTVSEILPSFSTDFDSRPEAFVEALTAILTIPANSTGLSAPHFHNVAFLSKLDIGI